VGRVVRLHDGGKRTPRQSQEILMPQYLLTLHSSTTERRPQMTREEMERSSSEIMSVNAALKSSGSWVYGGRLDEPSEAKVVRPRNSRIRVTDGPFIEAKEQIGGFYIIEAADLEAALEWASKTSDAVGMPIEVRRFAQGEAA
jgi:hypothetical protein